MAFFKKKPKAQKSLLVHYRHYDNNGHHYATKQYKKDFIQHNNDFKLEDDIHNFLAQWKRSGVLIVKDDVILYNNVFKCVIESSICNPGDPGYDSAYSLQDDE